MVKGVGLSRDNKKMIKFEKFSNNLSPSALFYVQSKSFFRVFQKSFRNGFESVPTHADGQVFDVPNLDISANLVVFHFAIELLLKALLSLKTGKLDGDYETHEIHKLLLKVAAEYPKAKEIQENLEYQLILEELGNYFNGIRYAEGTLCLRHNNKKGWSNKKPLQELSEALYSIYSKLLAIFDEENKPLAAKNI
jgi:hypothetical protein